MIINVIGWIIGIGAIAVPTYFVIRGSQRKKLEIDIRVDRLIVARVGNQEGLKVSLNGVPIDDPQMVEVRVVNVGKNDIASENFDQQKPLVLELDTKAVGSLQENEGCSTSIFSVSEDATSLLIAPTKIAAGSTHQERLLTDGPARVSFSDAHPLIDTDVTIGARERKRELRITKRLNYLGIALHGGTLVILIAWMAFSMDIEMNNTRILLVLAHSEQEIWHHPLFYGLLAITACAYALTIYLAIRMKSTSKWIRYYDD